MKRALRYLSLILGVTLVACASPTVEPSDGSSEIPASKPTESASANATTNADPVELTVGLTYIPDIQFAPFYLADARGYFADEGLSVNLRHHGAGESLFGALIAGDEHVVNAGADEMLQARSQGLGVTAFGLMYQDYPVVLIAREESGITDLADLKGATIGVPGPFGENWFALLALLESAGLSQDDVTIENIGFTLQTAMMSAKVDAVMGFSNNDVVALQTAGLKVRTFPVRDNPLKSIALGARDTFVEHEGETLVKLRRALARAMRDIIEDPDDAVQEALPYLPKVSGANRIAQAEDVLAATAQLYGSEPMAIDPADWAPMADFMAEHALLDSEVDPVRAVNALDEHSVTQD
ncbi:MAG: ABC transporter substrate-binding protein [Bowdeniella nasicola]|nr:ABC transporter substrate-binding protein [Bowdeniella nasicola]